MTSATSCAETALALIRHATLRPAVKAHVKRSESRHLCRQTPGLSAASAGHDSVDASCSLLPESQLLMEDPHRCQPWS